MNKSAPGSIREVHPIIGPEGLVRYSVVLNPVKPDSTRLYGAQGGVDSFWPSDELGDATVLRELPGEVNDEVWIQGIVGDPEERKAAMLVGKPTRREFGLRGVRLVDLEEY